MIPPAERCSDNHNWTGVMVLDFWLFLTISLDVAAQPLQQETKALSEFQDSVRIRDNNLGGDEQPTTGQQF